MKYLVLFNVSVNIFKAGLNALKAVARFDAKIIACFENTERRVASTKLS
jgi:hypothetical protein